MSLRLVRKEYRTLVVPMGAEGENDPTDKPEDQKDDTGEDTTEDDGEDSSGKSGEPVSREEFDRLFQRMQAADRRATAAETKVKEQDRAKMDDLTRAQAELEEVRGKLGETENALKTERLHNAFLASNTVTWHDPELAMSKIDLEGVQKDDGTIDSAALKKAIAALAKEKPFLVKSEDGNDSKGKNGSSGAGVGTDMGGNHKDKAAANRAALERKYPALRSGR
jgi:hypothetical protein